jgi:hypothetical protein
MRLIWFGFTFLLAASLSSSANSSETRFLCVGDLSTGFVLELGNWRTGNFNAGEEKLLVSPATPEQSKGGRFSYTVTRIGQDGPIHYCEKPIVEGIIVCSGMRTSFIIDTAILRYQEYYGIGYVHGDLPGNTPSISIGKCSKI